MGEKTRLCNPSFAAKLWVWAMGFAPSEFEAPELHIGTIWHGMKEKCCVIATNQSPAISALAVGEFEQDRPLLQTSSVTLAGVSSRPATAAGPCSVSTSPVQVVLAESEMPSWNWRKVLSDLRRLSQPPQLIVTSRTADDYLWAEVLNIGGYDVLPQPLARDEVERVIAAACRQHAMPPARAGAIATAPPRSSPDPYCTTENESTSMACPFDSGFFRVRRPHHNHVASRRETAVARLCAASPSPDSTCRSAPARAPSMVTRRDPAVRPAREDVVQTPCRRTPRRPARLALRRACASAGPVRLRADPASTRPGKRSPDRRPRNIRAARRSPAR